MSRTIAPEQLKKLSWLDEGNLTRNTSDTSLGLSLPSVSIDDMLNGQFFQNPSLPTALQKALEYATPEGLVLSMPELITAKVQADTTHQFWQRGYDTLTEENIGIDSKGRFYGKDKPLLVVVHGGGILNPSRIERAYTEKLINGSAKYSPGEFDQLLEGKICDETIPVYTLTELETSNLPRRFAIVMPYEDAQATTSGQHDKNTFLHNPLVRARAAGALNVLESYFDKAQRDGKLGSYHLFTNRDPTQAQGRLLFLSTVLTASLATTTSLVMAVSSG